LLSLDRGIAWGVARARSVLVILVTPDARPQSRWVYARPSVGSFIADPRGRTWRVAEVLQSGRETYTVICEPSRRAIAAVPELVSDLLERAWKAIPSSERKRGRFRSL